MCGDKADLSLIVVLFRLESPYDPMYQSLRAAAEARNCAMYVSDSYMASSAADNDTGSTNKNQTGSSNEGSSSNINITTTSATNINNGSMGSEWRHCHQSRCHCYIVRNRNSDEFHHYPLLQQQPQQPPHLRYNQHYGTGNNHEQPPLRALIKQNSPALLSIAQASHQAYSGRSPQRHKPHWLKVFASIAPHSPQKKKLTLRMKSLARQSRVGGDFERQAVWFLPEPSSTSHTPPYEPTEMTNYKYKGLDRDWAEQELCFRARLS